MEEGKEKNMHATRVANLQELLAIKYHYFSIQTVGNTTSTGLYS